MRHSVTCNPWEVWIVPFPFVDAPQTKRRPVVVISGEAFHSQNQHAIATMITSSQRHAWAGDTPIRDLEPAGLSIPCLIRLKLFTLDYRLLMRPIGQLSEQDQQALQQALRLHVG